jgi:hypothetical protein
MDRKDAAIAKEFESHEVQEVISRTWTFSRPDSWIMGCKITWTPGLLHLGGDIGELTVTHHHALRDLWSGIAWIAGADFEYLMEKTDAERQFDRDATVAQIVAMANEEALPCAQQTKTFRLDTAFEDAFAAAIAANHDDNAAEEIAQRGFGPYLKPARKRILERIHHARNPFRDPASLDDAAYYRWERLADATNKPPEDAYSILGRKWIKRSIMHACDTPHGAAELAHEAGFEDYYGCYSWPTRRRIQVQALKLWAQQMLASPEASRAA